MDKFAVDIEKVLDEFEYNEGREEPVTPLPVKNLSSSQLTHKEIRPPAASYRRAPFKPINLADADFSPAIISPAVLQESLSPTESVESLPEATESLSKFEGISDEINYEEKKPLVTETVIDTDIVTSDDTPDLLDSKTLIPLQNKSDSDSECNETNTHLPDITSVSAQQISSPITQPVFDLIKPNLSQNFEELPPVVSINNFTQEQVPDLQVNHVSFNDVSDAPDSEVEEYLSNLDIDECSAVDVYLEKDGENVCSSDSEVLITESSDPSLDNIPDNMGITGSSTKTEDKSVKAPETVQKPEPVDAKDSFRSNTDKASLLNDFPSEKAYNSKKSELDNINSRSCTNHSTSDDFHEQSSYSDEPSSSSFNEISPNDDSSVKSDVDEETLKNDELSERFADDEVEAVDTKEDEQGTYEGDRPPRPNSLDLTVSDDQQPPPSANLVTGGNMLADNIGKFPPVWIPDTEADNCMQCQQKFTMIKRRHHCRACGLVLCSKCCNLKAPLEFLEFMEARVCQPCFNIIYRVSGEDGRRHQPNPNNPMEYCSTIPPLQQASSSANQPPPSVMVPTSVLKREGKAKSDIPKQVIFSDGIRPGGDLTELDNDLSQPKPVARKPPRRLASPPSSGGDSSKGLKMTDEKKSIFFSSDSSRPPPAGTIQNGEFLFLDEVDQVGAEPVKFALNYNLFVTAKRVKLDCCVHRDCWSACSEGLASVGQDEVAIVIEALPEEVLPPLDIFHLVNHLYLESSKGRTVTEMCFTPAFSPQIFGSKEHGGFIYIRPTFQCTTSLLLPVQPYLIPILVHRWETPWARLFPLRLVLRLGAEYRYYPCPLVSVRNRPPLYTHIGHTLMKILMDFRKYSYSLATVRGLLIHMEDRQTTILFPRNRYDQVVRALNNSNESVLAFGANLSLSADSHLVCIQGTKDENSYHTQAINIHNKPRRVTGASFVVFNGALKTAGLTGKSSIMEDGLMVQLPSDSMVALRTALREMRDYSISCGPNDEETVLLQWTSDDVNFNIGVKSFIDGRPLDGVPSIRVHNGTDYSGDAKLIRWTEVFILQTEEGCRGGGDPIDISRVSEMLARAVCTALVPELGSLARSDCTAIAIRANIHPDNVSYDAGSGYTRLGATYMKRLDEELVPVVHQAAFSAQETPALLELVFRILHHP